MSDKVIKATKEQWKEIEAIYQQWVESQSIQVDGKDIGDIVNVVWEKIDKKAESPTTLICDSPYAAIKAGALISSCVEALDDDCGMTPYEAVRMLINKFGEDLITGELDRHPESKTQQYKAKMKSQPYYVSMGWCASAAWFDAAKVLGVSADEKKLAIFQKWARCVPFVVAYKELAIVSRKPKEIHWEDNRLNNESGPAILFPDGWPIWVIHGVRVDEQIVMRPETQTLDQIKNEENEEVKRIRIERYGWQKYLSEIDATVIDSRRNDVENTKEYFMKAIDQMVLLCHCPSTAKVFALEVGEEVTTCEDAQRWLWNMEPGEKMNIIGRS